MKRTHGITLIEMVVVVGIIGILGAIAYPSYMERALRAKRTDAKAALINIAGQQEKFFLQNNAFTDELSALGVETTQNEFYTLSLSDVTASTFTATATAAPGQDRDTDCNQLAIDQLGRRSATDSSDSDNSKECWR